MPRIKWLTQDELWVISCLGEYVGGLTVDWRGGIVPSVVSLLERIAIESGLMVYLMMTPKAPSGLAT